MLRMVFLFFRIPFKSKLLTVSGKTKTPFGVFVFCLIVELAGVEPASKHGDHTLSTCLVLLDFRDLSAAELPNRSLVPGFLAVRPEQSSGQPRIACASLSGWIRAGPPGRRPVPAHVPGLSLSYLIRLGSESVIRFAFCCFVTLFK